MREMLRCMALRFFHKAQVSRGQRPVLAWSTGFQRIELGQVLKEVTME